MVPFRLTRILPPRQPRADGHRSDTREPADATADLADARRRRYRGISDALAAGHPQHVVATTARTSPSALSKMIRQDATRTPDARLLPGLSTGKSDGKTIRWFEAALPLG